MRRIPSPLVLMAMLVGLGGAWGDEVPVKVAQDKDAAQLMAEGQEYLKVGRYDLAEKRARQMLALEEGNAEAKALLKKIATEWARYDARYFPQIGKLPPSLTERKSINKDYAVVFPERDRFVIQDASGQALFSSQEVEELRGLAEFSSTSVLWSRDSQAVALAGGNGHDLRTFVLVRTETGFELVDLPKLADGYDNAHILPYQWLEGRRLLLEISGPYAGKAGGSHYTGRASVRVEISPPRGKLDYEEIH